VIDTSSARSALALLQESGAAAAEVVAESGRGFQLAERVRELVGEPRGVVSRVAVATGPGSFTGLRVGASYAAGLALGLRIPLHALRTLELQAARARLPATALSEAGRGRIYFQAPGAPPRLGEPSEVPREHPAVGWLRPRTQAALEAAGARFLPEAELRSFGEAAARLLSAAPEVGYGRLKLEYMQSFGKLC